MPLRKIDERKKAKKSVNDSLKVLKKEQKKKPGKMGNPAVVTEYEDARENAMINRDIPTMKTGGICKGAGAAIKGTKFEGVF